MFDAVEYSPIATATKTMNHPRGWVRNPGHPGADIWFDKTSYLNILGIKIGHQHRRDGRRPLLIP